MFFTHDLLVGPRGQFALLWRAAVKREKLKKRQLESLDVTEICKALVQYIRPRADSKMGRIQGFSLRLSAQLVHGVIVCYNWKVAYLLDEALCSWKAVITKRYLMQELNAPAPKMKKSKNGVVTEENFQLDINFDADPMFGQMLDIADFPAILPPGTTTEESERAKKRRRVDKHVVADLRQITLQETVSINRDEGEDLFTRGEAVQFDLDDLNALTNGPFLFDPNPSTSKIPTATNTTLLAQATPVGAILSKNCAIPKTPTRHTTDKSVEQSILAVPLQQDLAAVNPPDEVVIQHAPVEENAHLPDSLVLEPLEGFQLPPGRKRKRRKLIIDSRIELRSDEIKKQLKKKGRTIQDHRDEGLLDEPIAVVPASVLFSNAAILGSSFNASCIDPARDDSTGDVVNIRNLFNATITDLCRSGISPVSGAQEQISGGPTEGMQESSILAARNVSAVSGLLQPPDVTLTAEEDAPTLIRRSTRVEREREKKQRESSLHGVNVSDVTPTAPFDDLRSDLAFHDMIPEPSRLNDLELGPLENEALQLGMNQYTETTVLSEVQSILERKSQATFAALAPSVMSKSEAARKFYALLACAKNRTVKLIQNEPFGEIGIGKYSLI